MKTRALTLLPPAILVAVVVAFGLSSSIGSTTIVGHPLGDGSDHVQGMWWFGGELLSGRFPLNTAMTHAPGPVPLWFIDPVGAIISLPFRFLGPAGAYNMAIMVQLWLSGMALWAMVRDLTGQTAGAWVGSLIVISSPFLLGVIHSGLSEYTGLVGVIGYIWILIRISDRDPQGRTPPPLAWLWGALALIFVAMQSLVLFLCAMLLTACFIPGCGWLGRLRRFAPMLATASLPIWGLAQLVSGTMTGPVGPESVPGWTKFGLPGVDILGFIWPFGDNFPNTPELGNPGVIQVHYLGWTTLILAFMGWRKLSKLVMPTVFYTLLCLGPVLVVAGQEIPSTTHALRLPLAMLYHSEMPFQWIHHPYRLTALLLPVVALFAAVGCTRLPKTLRIPLAGLILLESALVSPTRLPLASTNITPPTVYAALPDGPVMEWPPDGTDWNRRYVRWQAVHGHPIAYGVNVRLPDAIRRHRLMWNLFLVLDNPSERLWNRDDPPGPAPKPLRPMRSLKEQGFKSLVVHLDALNKREQKRVISTFSHEYGEPIHVSDDAMAWEIKSE